LRAKDFCSLDVLNEGLGVSKLQLLIKKKNFCCIFFPSTFGHQNPGYELDLYPYPDSLEMLDPDSMNPDPQHCWKLSAS
jgi:hypothetical protein